MAPTPTPDAVPVDPQASQGWLRAGLRALVGLLSLIVAFIPEIVASFFGVIFGVVLGIVSGAGLTASLLDGGGSWGHAGPIALVLPVFTFLGPLLICVAVGATTLPTLTLGIHAIVILVGRAHKLTAARLVVLTTAASVFVAATLFGLTVESFFGGAFLGVLFAPVTGMFGLLVGAAVAGIRSLLGGRSFAQWWTDADGSMGVGMLAVSLFAWLGTWFPFAILVLFPAVVLALLVALVLGARLWLAGKQRGVVVTVTIVNLVHALGLGWLASVAMAS